MPKFVPGPVSPGNVVKELYIGNTRVMICDDACAGRSAEELLESLSAISRIASEALAEPRGNEIADSRPEPERR